jgi:hypothetical protein
MKPALMLTILALALVVLPVRAQVLVAPSGDSIVLTDPVVRTTQLGYVPVGRLVGLDTRTGVAWAMLPGGGRWVRLLGAPSASPEGLAAPAVDLATGVQVRVLAPAVGTPLVRATLLRASGNGVTVRRYGAPGSQSELLPAASVFVRQGGWLLPAGSALAALPRGAEVLIPAAGGARGAIQVEQPQSGAATRRQPAKTATRQPARPAAAKRR